VSGGENRPAIGDFPAGSQVAGYQIQELVGRGGMAVVYRASDMRLDRQVALKVLAPELTRDSAFRQRFIRESRSGASVDHPNVVPVFEAGEADGVLFIAMRYVAGGDVRALIASEGPLRPSRVVSIVSQIASALDTAHARGLVHRDVKPANMLLGSIATGSAPDHVYLSDFGLSKVSVSAVSLTGTGQFLGTIDYMAPEQVEGRATDGRTDLYALACAAFEMLTGKLPFLRDQDLAVMWAQVSAPPPSARQLRPELPPEVDEVLAKALAKSPGDRYATCLEFAAALRAACAPGSARGAVPPATELAFVKPGSGAGGAPGPAVPAGPATPPATPGQPPADVAAASYDATITDAMYGVGNAPRGGLAAGPAVPPPRVPGPTAHDPYQGGSPYSPPGGYRQPSGYGQPGQTDQRWAGPGYQQRSAYQGPPPRRPGRVLPFLLGVLVILIVGGAAALVLYLRGHGSPQTGPGTHSSRTVSSGPPRSKSSSPAASLSPRGVVTAYYDAINNRDYAAAYQLSTYAQTTRTYPQFKSGYRGTSHDTLTVTGVSGNVVSFHLTADQTDGLVKTYTGTYTVRDGKIVAATVTRTS
jgi:tRNA A-37 threonylcarbamoyl transferase component Bud32